MKKNNHQIGSFLLNNKPNTGVIRKVAVLLMILGLVGIVVFFLKNSQGREKVKAVFTTRSEESLVLEEMTLEEKLRQMIVVGIGNESMDYSQLGGVILMKYEEEEREFVEGLQNETLAPLIMIDQEGGSVARIKEEWVTETKPFRDVTSAKEAFELAENRARELASIEVDVNLAPVIEHIEDEQSFLYSRTFQASHIEMTSKLGVEAMRGYRSGGLVPMVKHFPGHYENAGDPHKGKSVVNMNRDELLQRLLPFRQAIAANVEMIMTSHASYPEIDSEWPASLSEEIINGLLRNELGFDGVVISDDLGMGAIIDEYSVGEAAAQAVLAGSDMVMVASDYERQDEVWEALLEAIENGVISEERIDESVERVLRVKRMATNY